MKAMNFGILTMLLVAIATPAKGFDMLAFLKDGLKVCSKIEEGDKRLECYDMLAETQKEENNASRECRQ